MNERLPLPRIPSPCIGVCRLDPPADGNGLALCAGCMRTAEEIAAWPWLDDASRLTVVHSLKERRRAAGRISAADLRPRRRARLPVE